jgi:hypothetical protein
VSTTPTGPKKMKQVWPSCYPFASSPEPDSESLLVPELVTGCQVGPTQNVL